MIFRRLREPSIQHIATSSSSTGLNGAKEQVIDSVDRGLAIQRKELRRYIKSQTSRGHTDLSNMATLSSGSNGSRENFHGKTQLLYHRHQILLYILDSFDADIALYVYSTG